MATGDVMTEIIDRPDAAALTPEQVAKVVDGISFIGLARQALECAGFAASLVANRITVNQEIIAQFVSVNGTAWWQVYAAAGTPPVWIVGAEVAS